MLKSKNKAFKPKGPVRRPVPGASSSVPSREATREPTQETTPREATPVLKRKEREGDTIAQPPTKRLATPPPTDPQLVERRSTSPEQTAERHTAQQSQTPLLTEQDDAVATSTRQSPEATRSLPGRTPLPQNAGRPATQPTTTIDAVTLEPSQFVTELLSPPHSTDLDIPSSERTPDVPVHRQPSSSSAGSTFAPSRAQSNTDRTVTYHVDDSGASGSALHEGGASLGPAGGSMLRASFDRDGTGASSSLGGAGDVGDSNAGLQSGSQLVPMAALNPDGTSGGIIESPNDQGRKKKVIARRKAPTAVDIAQDDRATLDMELPGPRRRLGRPPKKQKTPREPKKRGEREDTPSGAEEEVVDPTTLTMSALCKDLRIGKKFSRHDDIKARVQKEKAESTARRSARDNSELAASTEEQEGDVSVVNANLEADAQAAAGGNADPSEAAVEEPDVAAPQGRSVMMRIVDGQIVVDERSVQIDRHREAQNAQDGPMEVVEENDFTRIITAGTYMKREKTSAWDWPAMDMFYKGLRTFGTDFGMIANMFPHRSRKQIKLRFNKEERENPELIARALSAPQIPINFEEYSKFSNKTFLETEEIHAEQQALKAEHEASLAAAESRNASANKKKKDAIRKNGVKDILDAVSDDEDDHAGGSSAKENRAPSAGAARSREASTAAGPGRRGGKKAAKPSRANKHSMRAGGEEVEVLGTVD